MSIHGYLVNLSSSTYEAPSCCSSCMGPRETEVGASISEKSGNVRTRLKMVFPYCNVCAKRARWEKVREILMGGVAALLGAALAIVAWVVDAAAGAPIRFALALLIAAGAAAALAMLTRGSRPALPATARGEAVILRDTRGTVLCTNPQFAQRLAEVNGSTARQGSQRVTVEVWAPIVALLCGVLVLLVWMKEGAARTNASASTNTSTSTSTSTNANANASASTDATASASVAAGSASTASARPASSARPPKPRAKKP